MDNVTNPADGKYVVIQGGQRVTAPTGDIAEAQREADRRNKLAESADQPVPEGQQATVKQNLFGAVLILALPNVVTVCSSTFTNLL